MSQKLKWTFIHSPSEWCARSASVPGVEWMINVTKEGRFIVSCRDNLRMDGRGSKRWIATWSDLQEAQKVAQSKENILANSGRDRPSRPAGGEGKE